MTIYNLELLVLFGTCCSMSSSNCSWPAYRFLKSPVRWSGNQCRKHIKKQRHYFANKDPSNQSYDFSSSHVWMWELDYKESWATKNWCFWIVVLEKTLESPWTARRSNQSILKETNPEYLLKGLMLRLKLQYFGHLIRRSDSLEKTLMLGKIEGRRRRDDRGWDGWMASPTEWTWVWTSPGRRWRTGKPGLLESMGLQRVRYDWVTEKQQDVHGLDMVSTFLATFSVSFLFPLPPQLSMPRYLPFFGFSILIHVKVTIS